MNSDSTGVARFNAEDTKIWVVTSLGANAERLLEVDLRTGERAVFLFSEDPKLEKLRLAKKDPIQLASQDGMTIYGYLTLPVGIPARSLPLVVHVHGGPWTRDSWRLDFPVQCLANRG
jgi:dipeptidyl aminopeptidase/acylaminoacyl peptidase